MTPVILLAIGLLSGLCLPAGLLKLAGATEPGTGTEHGSFQQTTIYRLTPVEQFLQRVEGDSGPVIYPPDAAGEFTDLFIRDASAVESEPKAPSPPASTLGRIVQVGAESDAIPAAPQANPRGFTILRGTPGRAATDAGPPLQTAPVESATGVNPPARRPAPVQSPRTPTDNSNPVPPNAPQTLPMDRPRQLPRPTTPPTGSGQAPAAPANPPVTETAPPATATAPAEAAPVATAELTSEEVNRRQQQMSEDSSLDDETKSRLKARYQQALEALRQVQDAKQKGAAWQAEVQAAPQLIESLKQQLAQPVEDSLPGLPPEPTVVGLEQLLAQSQVELESARGALAKLEGEAKRRSERKTEIPRLAEKIKQQLAELEQSMGVAVEGESAAVTLARQTELQARRQMLEIQTPLLKLESQRYEALAAALPLQLDLQKKATSRLEKVVAARRDLVADFRKAEAERQVREARQQVTNAHPAVKELAEENARLAELRTQFTAKIEQANAELESITKSLAAIDAEFQDVQEKEKIAGLTTAFGLLLRSHRKRLPPVDPLARRLSDIETEIPQLQLDVMELEAERDRIADTDALVDSLVAEMDPKSLAQARGIDVPQMVREMLESERTYLNSLLNDHETYLDTLGNLDVNSRRLIQQTGEYAAYIDERVLWIRSTEPLAAGDAGRAWTALAHFTHFDNWTDLFRTMLAVAAAKPYQSVLVGVFFVVVVFQGRRIRSHLRSLSARRSANGSVLPVIKALFATVLRASLWPALMALIGWWLQSAPDSSQFVRAVAGALRFTAVLFWTVNVFRQLCRSQGVAEVYFRWPSRGLGVLYRNLSWLMLVSLPLVFCVLLIEGHQQRDWTNSLGRLAFLGGLLALTVFQIRVFSPSLGVLRETLTAHPHGWLNRLKYVWYPLSVGTPLAFACLAFTGYYYTAHQLFGRLVATLWLGLGLLIAQSLAACWLRLLRRELEQEQRQAEALAQAEAEAEARAETDAATSATLETIPGSDPQREHHWQKLNPLRDLDLAVVGAQLQKLLSGVVCLTFLAGCWMIWSNVLPAIGILDRIELWPNTVRVAETVPTPDGSGTITQMVDRQVPTTLKHLILSVLVIVATFLAGRNLPGLLEISVLQKLPIDTGGRHAVTTIFRYLLTLVGLVVACRCIGITWASVQWLAAAMTVGLGFGLQEIFANLVSGLILLFERPIRVGDLVTVGGVTGNVTRMRIRATTILDFDRRELIVPNKKFITDDIVNWTLSDPVTRVVLPVGVAYGTDTNLTYEALMRVATANPHVMEEPPPTALFKGFGDSTLDFELRVFIPRRDVYTVLVHSLNTAIEQEFGKLGIEIAFPQRDIHIRTVNGLGLAIPPEEQTIPAPQPDEHRKAA